MENKKPTFEDFLFDVSPLQRPFIDPIHESLIQNDCQAKIEIAKSGYVVSYAFQPQKRVIANLIFRKKGVMIRIYGDNVTKYEGLLQTLPESMRKDIVKSSNCKRLLDPTKCNARCSMGNVFMLDGEQHKKCRYGSFMFLISQETAAPIQEFLANELRERIA